MHKDSLLRIENTGLWVKNMLHMIGTGLSDSDISLGAVEVCKGCEVFAETYTSAFSEKKLDYLSKIIGKNILRLGRSDLEENAGKFLSRAKQKEIALLVGGDPLIATTHKILFIDALKLGVEVKVWHSSSIVPAVMGESGLDFYRFGKVCTIPRFSAHYKPLSFYDALYTNHINNLHSLILLDYDPESLSTLSANKAIENIEKAEASYKKGVVNPASHVIVLKNLNSESEQKLFMGIDDVKKLNLKGMITLILPAKLTKVEQEAINAMYERYKK